MPTVAVPGYGTVAFPDSMTPAQIQQAIETEMLNQPPPAAKPAAKPPVKPAASIEDTNIFQDVGGSLLSGAGQLAALPGQLYGLATGDFDTAASRAAQGIISAGEAAKSAGLRERERLSQERIAKAGEEGFFPEAGQAIKEYATDPRLLLSGVLESAPSMLGGLGVGTVAGRGVRTLAARKATEEAAKAAARKVAVRTAVGTGAVQQGASVGEQTYQRAMELPEGTLAQSPAYNELLAAGATPQEARAELALTAARTAAAASTAVSAGTAGLMRGVEKTALGDAVAGGVLKRAAKSGATEAAQEGLEEGGGQLAQNVAISPVDVNADLMQGVGSAAAQGAIMGAGLGAPVGALSRGAPTVAPVAEPEPVMEPQPEMVAEPVVAPEPMVAEAAAVEPVVAPETVAPEPTQPAAAEPEAPAIEAVTLATPERPEPFTVSVSPPDPTTGRVEVSGLDAEGAAVEMDPAEWSAMRTTYEMPSVAAAPEPAVVAAAPEPAIGEAAPPTEPPVTPPPSEPAAPSPPPPPSFTLGSADESRLDAFRRKIVDKFRRVGYVEEQIEKATGKPLPRSMKPTEKAALFEGRSEYRLNKIEKDYDKPVREIASKNKLTPNEIDFYLLARTAKDRNAKIRERDPENDAGSGMTDEDADAIMENLRSSPSFPALEKVGERVDALVGSMLDERVEKGLMTREEADYLRKTEPHYVPLKGIAAGGDMSTPGDTDPHMEYAGKGASISRKEYRVAKGRSSLPFSPWANVISDAQTATIRGERNRVGQSLLHLAEAYPSDVWQVFSAANPPRDSEGNVIPPQSMGDKFLIVKREGETFFVKINDPLLRRAILNLSAKEWSAFNEVLGKSIGLLTKVLSRSYTTLNPEFFIPNYFRDIQSAVFNILAEQDRVDGRLAGKKILAGVLEDTAKFKNFLPTLRVSLNKAPRNEAEAETQRLFEQFKSDGGTTGWILRETPEVVMEKIKNDIERATATGGKRGIYATQDGLKKIIGGIEDFNSVFENVTRFSVYKRALEAGLTRDEAAMMSRNVTVDFNRKGEMGPTINALYAFFNAAVQGNVQLLRSLGSDPRKHGGLTRAQYLALGMIGLGAMQSMISQAMSDDDEDGKSFYDKIPDFEKERNLIVMMPDGRQYIKVPLPYGYSFFHSLGGNAVELYDDDDVSKFVLKMTAGLLDNFSPIVKSGESVGAIASGVFPTVIRPFIDLYRNENFFGSPIYNEPFDESQAKSSVPRYSTPEAFKAVAEFVNNVTGGEGKIPGKVDFPAEGYEYLFDFTIGGGGQFITRTYDYGQKRVTGQPTQAGDVPMGRKIFGEPSKYADLGDFYDRADTMKPVIKQMEDSTPAERKALRDKYPTETNSRVIAAMKEAEKRVREINKQRKALANNPNIEDTTRMERKARLDELQRDAYIRFNKIYNQVEGK